MDRLRGKVAIVTGAASGIGRASATIFAAEGASVVLVDREDHVFEIAAALEQNGAHAAPVKADASVENDVARYIDVAMTKYGRLDITFANAGVLGSVGHKSFLELDAEDWRYVLDINLVGVYFAIKHSARAMISTNSGSIICTASIAGLRGGAGPVAYSASKAGVINLVANAAQKLGGTGIRVNAICPGVIETAMTKPFFESATRRAGSPNLAESSALKRHGTAREIAGAALFLASDDASYVTGHSIVVDGGLTSSLPALPR